MMVTLEQVKLLESKVGKALAYVNSLSAENSTLREKLDDYRRRIDELETIVLAFKEDQGMIEAGILSALERLNQFEDAVEDGIAEARDDLRVVEAPVPPADIDPDEGIETEAEPSVEDKSGELDIF